MTVPRRCALDGCTKPLVTRPPATMPKNLRAMFMQALAGETYCSSECCRAAHGVPIAKSQGRQYGTAGIPMCGSSSGYASGCRCEECRAYMRDCTRTARQRSREATA